MENRLLSLQRQYLALINSQEGKLSHRDEPLDWERLHMASCARLAWLLALKRGVKPELAACAATIHDIGRVITGLQADHAAAGAVPAQQFLAATNLFSQQEILQLVQAVAHHSSKAVIGSPLEEIVKDADVVDCFQYGLPFARKEQQLRYEAWEKGIVFSPYTAG